MPLVPAINRLIGQWGLASSPRPSRLPRPCRRPCSSSSSIIFVLSIPNKTEHQSTIPRHFDKGKPSVGFDDFQAHFSHARHFDTPLAISNCAGLLMLSKGFIYIYCQARARKNREKDATYRMHTCGDRHSQSRLGKKSSTRKRRSSECM